MLEGLTVPNSQPSAAFILRLQPLAAKVFALLRVARPVDKVPGFTPILRVCA